MKTAEFIQTVNLLTTEFQLSQKKILAFFKTRFKFLLLMADIGQVFQASSFHDLDLPPFQNNVGLVPGVVTSGSSQQIKIEIDNNCQQARDFSSLIENGKWSNLCREIFQPEFQTSFRLEGMSEIQAKKPLSKVAFLVILACGNELNRTIFVIMYKIKGFRAKLVGVIVSTFLIFTFLIISFSWVFFQLYYLAYAKRTTMADFRYKSLKS